MRNNCCDHQEESRNRYFGNKEEPKPSDLQAIFDRVRKFPARAGMIKAGRMVSCKVTDGWLIAWNAGEWGGSLWWYSADGEQIYLISRNQIVQFLPTTQGIFALEGLAHLDIDHGQIVRIKQNAEAHWTSTRFVDLGHAPYVGLAEEAGNLIVATRTQLLQIHPDTTRTVLLNKVFWSGLYPTSMVLSPAGDIYLGMRHGVSRVHEVNHTYTAEWLLPNKEFVNAKPQY